jgi:hypothetical protein
VQIQSASAYSALSPASHPSRQKQISATVAASATALAATSADWTTISQAARDLFAAQSKTSAPAESGASAVFETDQGAMTLNIDDYFSPPANTKGSAPSLPPLLLPNPRNIDALASHISAALPEFLARNNIPLPPSSITYDNQGQVQLPANYPYATEFKQALASSPTMARELSTVNALTSQLVEMKKSIPFQQEYAAAATQAEADAVVARYSYLFSTNRHYDTIALHFSAGGHLTLSADGTQLS